MLTVEWLLPTSRVVGEFQSFPQLAKRHDGTLVFSGHVALVLPGLPGLPCTSPT